MTQSNSIVAGRKEIAGGSHSFSSTSHYATIKQYLKPKGGYDTYGNSYKSNAPSYFFWSRTPQWLSGSSSRTRYGVTQGASLRILPVHHRSTRSVRVPLSLFPEAQLVFGLQ